MLYYRYIHVGEMSCTLKYNTDKVEIRNGLQRESHMYIQMNCMYKCTVNIRKV